jgi:hypothetical protein
VLPSRRRHALEIPIRAAEVFDELPMNIWIDHGTRLVRPDGDLHIEGFRPR